jgi:hypothetical protein
MPNVERNIIGRLRHDDDLLSKSVAIAYVFQRALDGPLNPGKRTGNNPILNPPE